MDFRKGRGREELEINLIPFIDVLLVILIFMMVTTTYSKVTSLQITLPTTTDPDKTVEAPFEINVAVDTQGHYAINNAPVSATDSPALADELKRISNEKGDSGKDPIITINADGLASHQSVINVLEAARLAGFDKVTFAHTSGKK
jgi:biopolymer transport protein ExbD